MVKRENKRKKQGEMMEGFFVWMLEASSLVGMILVIRRVFMGKIRYGIIYALWGLVLLRFLIPVNMVATPVSIENIFSKAFSAWETAELPKEGEKNNNTVKEKLSEEKGRGELLTEGVYRAVSGKKQEEVFLADSVRKGIVNEQGKMSAVSDTNREKKFFIAWHRFLPFCWAAGSVLLFLWLFLSNVSLLGKMKKERIFYGKKENVKIYAVCGIKNPCLYGFFRPAIYLPYSLVLEEGVEKVSKEELEQVITHEFVHYRHGDHIWAMFRMLLVSVCWFNPFAWIAASCSKKDAELFCDETVIRLLGEEKRFCYGEMLVRLAGKPDWGDFRYSMLPMSRKGKEMERRIRAISGKRSYSKWMIFPLLAALCMAAGITCSAGMDSVAEKRQETVKEKNNSKKTEYISDRAAMGHIGLWQENAGGSRYPYASLVSLENALKEARSGAVPFSDALKKDTTGKAEDSASALQGKRADTPEEVFDWYIKTFTAAVNTGTVDKMNQVLSPDCDVYVQQCNLVKNYYKRGIREKVKSYSVSVREREDDGVEIDSKERIKVFYADGESRIVKQTYRYICERYADGKGGWIITGMEEI
ncbi:MAG TPA: hypothetical protein DCZ23_05875 [Lachnospiraceae bacterium]|nr:hypothetical protein [Lachnospiraceae bacterium]